MTRWLELRVLAGRSKAMIQYERPLSCCDARWIIAKPVLDGHWRITWNNIVEIEDTYTCFWVKCVPVRHTKRTPAICRLDWIQCFAIFFAVDILKRWERWRWQTEVVDV